MLLLAKMLGLSLPQNLDRHRVASSELRKDTSLRRALGNFKIMHNPKAKAAVANLSTNGLASSDAGNRIQASA